MQGRERADRQLLDAAALVGHLVPESSVFAFLARHRREVFPAELFADLFPASTGRPSLPGEVAASVLVLQALHDLSDRDAVAAVRCDIRWKVACGLPLDHEGFHPTTLTYWRRRLAASDRPDRIFEAVRAVITATGVLGGKSMRALDSVVLDDAVATQDTVTQLIAAIRRVGREVPGAAAIIGERCGAHDGRWQIARQVASDRVISTVDPDSRHVHKSRHRRQDGYKAHVAIEPGTGLFTAGRLTRGTGEDNHEAVVGLELLAGEDAGPLEVLGDTAYGSGQARAGLAAAGHTAIIKPGPLRPAVAGGFTIDDFTIDAAAGTATCPNGVTRAITPRREVIFGAACTSCPLRARCTTRPRGRVLHLHPHDATLRQARRDWASREDLRDTYRQHRPMVERSIAWLIGPKSRCRQLRYRGVSKNNQWLHLRMAGLNLRRLINLGLQPAAAGWIVPDPA
jgi:IS5 family transposase